MYHVSNYLTCEHELIGIVRDGEDVGWCLNPLLAFVSFHNYSIVHGKPLVGVHDHTEQARVGLEKSISSGKTKTCGFFLLWIYILTPI